MTMELSFLLIRTVILSKKIIDCFPPKGLAGTRSRKQYFIDNNIFFKTLWPSVDHIFKSLYLEEVPKSKQNFLNHFLFLGNFIFQVTTFSL